MKHHILLGLCAITSLSGCYSYPRLADPGPPPTDASGATPELDVVLADAATLQGDYSDGYRGAARFADLSQLPIVAAAAAAAWVLLDNKTGAANLAGKIAIGAGAYSAARGQLSATSLADAYIAGHGALTCVLAQGSLFSGTAANARYHALDAQLQSMADTIDKLDVELVVVPGGTPNADQTAMLAAARTLARQTITQARAAEQASLAQAAAFDTASRVFRVAVANISVRVASRGRVRPSVDFGTLRDSFAAAPKTAVTTESTTTSGGTTEKFVKGAPADTGPTTEMIVTAITTATTDLVTETARLGASTPHYAESLTAVAACPATISS